MVNVIVLGQTVSIQAAPDHIAAVGYLADPADVARLTPFDGRGAGPGGALRPWPSRRPLTPFASWRSCAGCSPRSPPAPSTGLPDPP